MHTTRRLATILDTGSGRSFITKDILTQPVWKSIKPSNNGMNIRDANNRSVRVEGTIDLVINIGGTVEPVRFDVVEHLATQIISGCDYCDKLVESIPRRQLIVKLFDASTVPIVRKPAPIAKDAIPLPEEQKYEQARYHTSNIISVISPTVLQSQAQNCVHVSSKRHGLITIEPLEGILKASVSSSCSYSSR